MKANLGAAAWSVLAAIAVLGGTLGAAGPLAAQEAMMLEKIGAVRMASPAEVAASRAAPPQPSANAAYDLNEPMMLERIGAVRMGRAEPEVATASADTQNHLWYAGAHANAYYAIDTARGDLTVTVEPGPAGGERATVHRSLADGKVERVTVSRVKDDRLVVTLAVTRRGAAYDVAVTTQAVPKDAGF